MRQQNEQGSITTIDGIDTDIRSESHKKRNFTDINSNVLSNLTTYHEENSYKLEDALMFSTHMHTLL